MLGVFADIANFDPNYPLIRYSLKDSLSFVMLVVKSGEDFLSLQWSLNLFGIYRFVGP